MKSYAPYHPELCSLPSRAMLLSFQSIALCHPEHCSQPSRALLLERSEAMLLAFKSIALGVRKHSSQFPKALIPVFEKKVPSHFDLTYAHFTLNYFCIKYL